jgi:transcriptional regulator NrdR family protein
MEHLQRLDPVAYVRFASVYRKFKDVGQFVEEVKGLQRDDKAKPAAAAKPKVVAKTK